MLLPVIACLFIAATAHGSNTSTSITFPHTFASNTSTSSASQSHPFASNATSNATAFAPLAAPIYRNVTAGDAWIFPSSANDLGARTMACECFSPDDQCCMPGSPSVAPFCIPSGSTCCGDTFCNVGESCCGAGCCAANTTCNIKLTGSGCCPFGDVCSGPLNCYDNASSNCSNQAVPALPQCCPADTPFCRDFTPGGLGCYAFSTTASPISSLPTMTAAGTSDLFAVPFQTPTSVGAAHTVTISVVSKGDGEFSLEFPTNTAPIGGGEGTSTTYVLEWPAASSTAAVALMSSSSAASSTTPIFSSKATATTTASSSTTTTQAAVASSSASTSPSSSTISLLCYDPNANSRSPCPTTTTSPASASTSSSAGGFHPPGAKIVNSQASTPLRVPFLDALRDFFALFPASFQTDRDKVLLLFIIAAIAYFIYSFHSLYTQHIRQERNQPQQPRFNTISDTDIANVKHNDTTTTTTVVDILKDTHDSESEGVAKHAITVVKGSARPFLEPRVVEKGEIQVVEGSARPFVKGKRTHSLWEGMGLGGAEDGGGGIEEVVGEMGEGKGRLDY